MKRILSLLVAGVVLMGGSMAFAGGACCASKDGAKDAKTDKSVGCSGETLSKLNLTDEQKKKVEALKAECTKDGGCSEGNHAKFMKGLKEILTADQLAQCKAACEKDGKSGCPMMKKDDSKS